MLHRDGDGDVIGDGVRVRTYELECLQVAVFTVCGKETMNGIIGLWTFTKTGIVMMMAMEMEIF